MQQQVKIAQFFEILVQFFQKIKMLKNCKKYTVQDNKIYPLRPVTPLREIGKKAE